MGLDPGEACGRHVGIAQHPAIRRHQRHPNPGRLSRAVGQLIEAGDEIGLEGDAAHELAREAGPVHERALEPFDRADAQLVLGDDTEERNDDQNQAREGEDQLALDPGHEASRNDQSPNR